MKRYYGQMLSERTVGAMRVAELDATVPAHAVLEHTHEEAHFVLVIRGAYVSSAADMPEVSATPLVVFNPPGTTHRDRFAAAGGRFLSVSLPADQWLQVEGRTRRSRAAHRLGIGALVAACRLRAELVRWDFASPLEHEAGCAALIAEAVRTLPLALQRPGWLGRVRERLHEDDPAPPSLAQLAADAGVHPVYLSRAFRRHFGCSPGAYLRQVRLARAAERLRGSATIAEAAQEAGFFDQSHLHRSLREAVGLSPVALRRLLRGLEAEAGSVRT